MNRWIPLSLAAFAGAVVIGCSGVMAPSAANSPAPSASGAPAGAVAFRANVVPVLQQHCAGCHTAGRGGAQAVEMFSASGEPQHNRIQPRIGDMVSAIRSGRMPLGKPGSVPEDQIKTLEAWQGAGAPNN